MESSDISVFEKPTAETQPRQKKSIRRTLTVAGGALILIVALAVGLGVGLSHHKQHGNNKRSVDITSIAAHEALARADTCKITPIPKPPTPTRTCTAQARPTLWQPALGDTWQIVLKTPIDISRGITPNDVHVWDIDTHDNGAETIAALHKANKKVICYFSAGSFEDWRDDRCRFNEKDMGGILKGWCHERWLNTSSPDVRTIMADRVCEAAKKGCDAIDPDNIDGYDNPESHIGLTPKSATDYMKFLRAEARKYNMAIGLKNSGDIVKALVDVVDFSVNEECIHQANCRDFKPFTDKGKPVFNIEYPAGDHGKVEDIDPTIEHKICTNHVNDDADEWNPVGSEKFSKLMADAQLTGPVKYCNGTIYHTPTMEAPPAAEIPGCPAPPTCCKKQTL